MALEHTPRRRPREPHISDEKWLDAGMLSDARRNLEDDYPEIFDRTVSPVSKVATLLSSGPFLQKVKSVPR